VPLITAQSESGDSVSAGSLFAVELRDLIRSTRPKRILETGTMYAMGSTRVIGEALKEFNINADFRSIEIQAERCEEARANAKEFGIEVKIECGLSIPRSLLPSKEDIKWRLSDVPSDIDVFTDFEPEDRVESYFAETRVQGAASDLIGKVLDDWDGMADLILLDSAGHIGWSEFIHVLAMLRGPAWFALDDTRHVKHFKSRLAILEDSHFRVVADSPERFGFLIAHYMP